MEKELNYIVVEETQDTTVLADYENGELIIKLTPVETGDKND